MVNILLFHIFLQHPGWQLAAIGGAFALFLLWANLSSFCRFDQAVKASNQRILAEIAHNIINRDEFADLADHTLILLDRSNFRHFHSCLIWLGEEIREQMQ